MGITGEFGQYKILQQLKNLAGFSVTHLKAGS
jgi:hypothetical protein